MNRLRTLITEAHRRSLWQVLLIYVGAGWIVFEIVQTVTEGLGLPQWFPAFAALLLLIGLPVVLATAFVREGEPAGAVSDPTLIPLEGGGLADVRRRRVLTWRNAGLSFMAALAVWGVVATGWLLLGERATATEDERKSIAVLPLANMSANEEDQYFTDGIHDAIIEHLAKIGDLKVISRTSVMEYRDTPKNIRQIAEELGVATLLEGGVQRAGGRVRITAQLIAAQTDEHLWAESYERELTAENLFAIQSDVAKRIAGSLKATLAPAERERIEEQPTDNLDAYDHYLRALSVGNYQRIQLLERSIELDSTFALAYAALSETHSNMFYQQIDRSTARLEMARQTAEKARQLDPDLAEAHWALARYYSNQGDGEQAASARQEAIRLDPNSVRALRRKADDLWDQGRGEEAMPAYLQALARDPRDSWFAFNIAGRFHYLHDFENAERYYDHAISLGNSAAMGYRALLYLAWSGDTAKARAALGGQREACGFLGWQLQDTADRLCDESQLERRLSQTWSQIVEEGATSSSLAAQVLITRAWWHRRRGEPEQERAAYDSARIVLEPIVDKLPNDEIMRSGLGIAYAGVGRREEAIREGRRGVELLVGDTIWFYQRPGRVLNLARIYLMVGDYDDAVEQLETLPTDRGLVTPAWLGADPLWQPLHDHPRFQALLAKHE